MPDVDPSAVRGRPWPEADALFRHDPRWKGSDKAYSMELSPGRVLWWFDDTWIADEGTPRKGSTMINNSVAIQEGNDPTTASIRFYWDDSGPEPRSFFPNDGEVFLWPMDAALLDGRLLFFCTMVRLTGEPGPWGFEVLGWLGRMVDNPHDEPSEWTWRDVHRPTADGSRLYAGGSVVVHDGYVHSFGRIPTFGVGATRWTVEDAAKGDLSRPEVWAGDELGWVPEADGHERAEVMPNGHTEFSIRWDERLGRWVQIQGIGIEPATLGLRTAERLEGPWTPLETVYVPEEHGREGVLLYAFKAHVEQDAGGDIVATYASNSSDDRASWDETLYYPRFVRLSIP